MINFIPGKDPARFVLGGYECRQNLFIIDNKLSLVQAKFRNFDYSTAILDVKIVACRIGKNVHRRLPFIIRRWQYKVTNPLDFGEHIIKITIKDKNSNETISENTYKINIAEKTEVVNNKTTSPKNHRTCIIIGIIALILSAILLIWILIARRRRKKQRNY